ncbi:hypothetical protein [Photobacterium kasasachensis]|uniref:hypothetical protein n=1 Tax=Photobacterium kasasachensis TaxID=2910240 RepID=UPI003D09D7A7
MDKWLKNSIISGIVSALLSFIFILLALLGVSKELVLLPIVIGVLVFLIVLFRNPDFWELRVAQASFTLLILTQSAYHLELRLDDQSIEGVIVDMLFKMGGNSLVGIIFAIFTIVFTILFRYFHRPTRRYIVLASDDIHPDVIEQIKTEAMKAAEIPIKKATFGATEKGSTKIPCNLAVKYARRLELAFYSGKLSKVIIHRKNERFMIVDVDSEHPNSFRILFNEWLGYHDGYFKDKSIVKKRNWITEPASTRSFINRALAVVCRSLVCYELSNQPIKLSKRFYFTSALICLVPLIVFVAFKLDDEVFFDFTTMLEMLNLMFMVTIMAYVLFYQPLSIVRNVYSSSSKDKIVASMALFEISVVLKYGNVEQSSLHRLKVLEDKVSKLPSVDSQEYRKVWASVAREVTRSLKNTLTGAPWDSLLSIPVYQRFDPLYDGELFVLPEG